MSSSTPAPASSTSTGNAPPVTSSPCSAQRPAATPTTRDLSDLVGELSTQSAEFRTRWAAHNVRFHDTGVKDLHHPVVGDITLTYNRMELAADPGQALTVWTAEPGSKSAEALSLLGSWAATPEDEFTSAGHEEQSRHSGPAE
jgi:hypothetical protein